MNSRVIVCAVAKVTPPVSTVSVVLSPSRIEGAATCRLKAVWSLAEMVISTSLPIAVPSRLAATVMVSASSSRVSSTTVMVALPAVAPGAIVMSGDEIV